MVHVPQMMGQDVLQVRTKIFVAIKIVGLMVLAVLTKVVYVVSIKVLVVCSPHAPVARSDGSIRRVTRCSPRPPSRPTAPRFLSAR